MPRNSNLPDFAAGYDAERAGQTEASCPHNEAAGNWRRSDWLEGMAESRRDRVDEQRAATHDADMEADAAAEAAARAKAIADAKAAAAVEAEVMEAVGIVTGVDQ